jgi:hypothetical protein
LRRRRGKGIRFRLDNAHVKHLLSEPNIGLTIKLKKLQVRCPNCNLVFPSGFLAESAIQLIGFYYLCPRCRRIFPCRPPQYLEIVDGREERAMKREETFALPLGPRIEISGPDVFELNEEVSVKPGTFMTSDRAIIKYEKKDR